MQTSGAEEGKSTPSAVEDMKLYFVFSLFVFYFLVGFLFSTTSVVT